MNFANKPTSYLNKPDKKVIILKRDVQEALFYLMTAKGTCISGKKDEKIIVTMDLADWLKFNKRLGL